MSDKFPTWVPISGEPLPGYGNRPHGDRSGYRQLTLDELKSVAQAFHPRITLAEMDEMPMPEFEKRFYTSKENIALNEAQRTSYAKLDNWQALCASVRRSLPPAYEVADRTYPRYYPTYMIVIDAPVEPGSIDDRFLVVHMSYLVPYYFYYELHSRRIDGKIRRDPLRYEVTPVFADALASIEREIAERYGYWRMSAETALVKMPEIYVNGHYDFLDGDPPTLQDALFTPQRW